MFWVIEQVHSIHHYNSGKFFVSGWIRLFISMVLFSGHYFGSFVLPLLVT